MQRRDRGNRVRADRLYRSLGMAGGASMTYHHYAPNGWGGLRTAEQKMHDAFDQRRKQWHSTSWFTLDFWGPG